MDVGLYTSGAERVCRREKKASTIFISISWNKMYGIFFHFFEMNIPKGWKRSFCCTINVVYNCNKQGIALIRADLYDFLSVKLNSNIMLDEEKLNVRVEYSSI